MNSMYSHLINKVSAQRAFGLRPCSAIRPRSTAGPAIVAESRDSAALRTGEGRHCFASRGCLPDSVYVGPLLAMTIESTSLEVPTALDTQYGELQFSRSARRGPPGW